jgi:hypothetical protein
MGRNGEGKKWITIIWIWVWTRVDLSIPSPVAGLLDRWLPGLCPWYVWFESWGAVWEKNQVDAARTERVLHPPPPRGALRLDGSWVPRKLRLGEGATCMKFGSSSRLVVSCSCSRLSSGFTYGSSSWEVGFAANYTSYHHRVSRGAATPWRNCNRARPQGHMDGTATPWQNGGLAAQPLLGAARWGYGRWAA